jgi:hypothetical protein
VGIFVEKIACQLTMLPAPKIDQFGGFRVILASNFESTLFIYVVRCFSQFGSKIIENMFLGAPCVIETFIDGFHVHFNAVPEFS